MTDLLSYCDKQLELTDRVTSRIIIGLPRIERQGWEAKFSNLPSVPPVVCSDELGIRSLLNIILNTTPRRPGNLLNEQQWKLLLGVVAGHSDDKFVWIENENTPVEISNRKDVLDKIESRLFEMDVLQEKLGKQIPPGPQRIRGIAGSGKTVILAQRAAHLHLKYPDWDLAFIFFTRSLYDQINSEVDRWLRRFSNEQVTLESANKKIQILHAWGAKDQKGFYSQFWDKLQIPKVLDVQLEGNLNVQLGGNITEKLAQLYCNILKHQPPIEPCYDAILIDEGQDLVVNEQLKFEERQPIYWLAWQALRPISSEEPYLRRLYWAYDEFQSLDALVVPEYKELFGKDLAEKLVGESASVNYKGNISKNAVMRCCYRIPRNILVAAFAMGAGLLRPQGRLSRFNKEDLEYSGFTMEGDLRSNNSLISIWREAKNSKNPISELWKEPFIEFQTFNNRQEEVQALVQKINEAKNSGFKLDKQLMVICLGDNQKTQIQQRRIAESLTQAKIDFFISGSQSINQIEGNGGNPSRFWVSNAITLTGIYRAKGNEAFWVFITGLENIKEDSSQLRNQLFVAMTRTKGWLWISGLEQEPNNTLYEEMRQAIQSNGHIQFHNRVDVDRL